MRAAYAFSALLRYPAGGCTEHSVPSMSTFAGRYPLSASISLSLMNFSLVFNEFGTVGSMEPTWTPRKLKCLFDDASKAKFIGETYAIRIRVAITRLTLCLMSARLHFVYEA